MAKEPRRKGEEEGEKKLERKQMTHIARDERVEREKEREREREREKQFQGNMDRSQ